MTKRQATKEYLRLYRKMMELNGSCSEHISRKDNNKVFDMAWKCREIAGRILDEYEQAGKTGY